MGETEGQYMTDAILDYAPVTPRRRSRLALLAMLWAIASPAITVAAVWVGGPSDDMLLPHFFCCHHRALGAMIFEGFPAAAALLGSIAMLRVVLSGGMMKGVIAASIAIAIGAVAAYFGAVLFSAIRA
jgi:hypothetical protein